jgi:hypothetical protein
MLFISKMLITLGVPPAMTLRIEPGQPVEVADSEMDRWLNAGDGLGRKMMSAGMLTVVSAIAAPPEDDNNEEERAQSTVGEMPQKVDDALVAIAASTSLEELAAWAEREEATKNRKRVIDALKARLEALDDAPPQS